MKITLVGPKFYYISTASFAIAFKAAKYLFIFCLLIQHIYNIYLDLMYVYIWNLLPVCKKLSDLNK